MIVIINHYDSFVYNLKRMIDELGYESKVFLCDQVTVSDVIALNPSHIVLSPGPCTPSESGVSRDLVEALMTTTPFLGVCLGHQILGEVLGGQVTRALRPMHGKLSMIKHTNKKIFENLPNPMPVARYHSLIVNDLNHENIDVLARSQENEVMAFAHKEHPLYGMQFHPESILTQHGFELLSRFLMLKNNYLMLKI